jgi:hypothetical protein
LVTEVTVLAFFGWGFGQLELDPVTLAGPQDIWSCFFPELILTCFFGVAATVGASESSIIIFHFSDRVRFLQTLISPAHPQGFSPAAGKYYQLFSLTAQILHLHIVP